jgi:phenol 2-monooxygenase
MQPDRLPSLLLPAKGRYGLRDYEKAFCTNVKAGHDIFEMRGIDRESGCVVIVRPDQYIAHVLPLADHSGLTAFFAEFMLMRDRLSS